MEEVAIDQNGISCKVATLHSWVTVMVKNRDREERYNAVNCDSLRPLLYAADPRHIVDD